MRVLVTGAAGFIGTAVVGALRAGETEVVALDSLRGDVHRGDGRRGDDPLSWTSGGGPGVRRVRADVRDRGAVEAAMSGTDAVVHLAAKVGLGVDLDDLDDYVASNDLGTAVVAQSAAAQGIGALVVASSMVVYGEGAYSCPDHGSVRPAARRPADLNAGRFEPRCPVCGLQLRPGLVDEDAPIDPRNGYAATKAHQEQLAAVWAREVGGRAIALRFHNVYGPGLPRDTPYAGVAAVFASALARGDAPRVFEDGGQRRDFVHVDDVARAVVAASGAALGGTVPSIAPGAVRAYNVGSGVVHTIGDLAGELAAAWGGPEPVVTGDFRLGDVRHVTASSARIAGELGWRAAVPFQAGIGALAAELRAAAG